jgi:integrase
MRPPPRKHRDHQRYLTVEELRRILAACNPRDKALFLCVYELALRASEPGCLRWEDLKGGRIHVRRGKGSDPGEFAVSKQLQDAIGALPQPHDGPIFPGRGSGTGLSRFGVSALWIAACRRAGISERAWYPHILKHSRCTHLADAGVAQKVRMHIAGWRSSGTADRYTHLTPRMVAEGERITAEAMRLIGG